MLLQEDLERELTQKTAETVTLQQQNAQLRVQLSSLQEQLRSLQQTVHGRGAMHQRHHQVLFIHPCHRQCGLMELASFEEQLAVLALNACATPSCCAPLMLCFQ